MEARADMITSWQVAIIVLAGPGSPIQSKLVSVKHPGNTEESSIHTATYLSRTLDGSARAIHPSKMFQCLNPPVSGFMIAPRLALECEFTTLLPHRA